LIFAAKRQRDLLQLKRQAYLQQIFPRDSEQRPQLRFSGFNDDWKPIQLRSIINRIRRQNTNNETQHILTISAQDGLIDQNTYFGRRIASKDDSNYLLIKQGEFAYNKSYSRDFPMGAIKRLKRYSEGALSPLYIAFSVHNVVPEFMEALFDSGVWHSEVMRLATEGARNHGLLNISPNDFFSMRLMIPENMKEQQYIAKFFQVLNSLVSAAEHKVNTLYELKQGYMQKMFI
jgi:type I restriction enzyme S subunit